MRVTGFYLSPHPIAQIHHQMQQRDATLHATIIGERTVGLFGPYQPLDGDKVKTLAPDALAVVDHAKAEARRAALWTVSILPVGMFVCYLLLIGYFKSKGGYAAEVLVGHAASDGREFTGGVAGPVD